MVLGRECAFDMQGDGLSVRLCLPMARHKSAVRISMPKIESSNSVRVKFAEKSGDVKNL